MTHSLDAKAGPERFWISFADCKEFQPLHIRQWQSTPFDGGFEYVRVPSQEAEAVAGEGPVAEQNGQYIQALAEICELFGVPFKVSGTGDVADIVRWIADKIASAPTIAPVAVSVKAFGLSAEQIETLRSNGLKPEEIAGDQRTQANRVGELLHWFVRLARDSANPKWTRSHAFELAYYLATTDDRAPFDISAVERASWLKGLQEPPEIHDMAIRHGWIPASAIIPAKPAGVVRQVRDMFDVEYHDDGRIASVGHASDGLRKIVTILDAALQGATDGVGHP